MSITYTLDRPNRSANTFYSLSYKELKNTYKDFVRMTDNEFFDKFPDALHLACMISWLKERGQDAVSDTGIVHEMIHYMTIDEHSTENAKQKIREQFNEDLRLS